MPGIKKRKLYSEKIPTTKVQVQTILAPNNNDKRKREARQVWRWKTKILQKTVVNQKPQPASNKRCSHDKNVTDTWQKAWQRHALKKRLSLIN